MKRTKFIVLALTLAVVMLGAGYAYWSETLTVSNTVKTGELDLQFKPLALLDGDDTGDYDDARPYGHDYMDVSLTRTDNNHKLVFSIEDIYPGAGGYMQFRIENTGTVPAQLTDIVATVTDSAQLKDEFNYVIHSLRIYTPATGWLIGVPVDFPMYADTFDDFVGKLEAKLNQYTLEPGGILEINGEGSGYDIQLPSTVEDDNFENQTFEFELGLNFQQTD